VCDCVCMGGGGFKRGDGVCGGGGDHNFSAGTGSVCVVTDMSPIKYCCSPCHCGSLSRDSIFNFILSVISHSLVCFIVVFQDGCFYCSLIRFLVFLSFDFVLCFSVWLNNEGSAHQLAGVQDLPRC
jgi:hypothetical protein